MEYLKLVSIILSIVVAVATIYRACIFLLDRFKKCTQSKEIFLEFEKYVFNLSTIVQNASPVKNKKNEVQYQIITEHLTMFEFSDYLINIQLQDSCKKINHLIAENNDKLDILKSKMNKPNIKTPTKQLTSVNTNTVWYKRCKSEFTAMQESYKALTQAIEITQNQIAKVHDL